MNEVICRFAEREPVSGLISSVANGGEGGIRTLGTRERTTVFETAPFDHSGTSPLVEGKLSRAQAYYTGAVAA